MRKALAISLAKLASFSSKILKLGSGSSLPGRIALKIYPRLLHDLALELKAQQKNKIKNIIITGTNGKTTTTGLLKSILKTAGYHKIICNDLGANLYYGVATAFIKSTSALFKLNKDSIFLIEADEAALHLITQDLDPELIAVTNLFRDQLDRFGELDATQKLINKGISACPNSPALVLNANDAKVSGLGYEGQSKTFYSVLNESGKAAEIKDFDAQRQKQRMNTDIDISSQLIELDSSSSLFELRSSNDSIKIQLMLPGLYNVYNATAAASCAIQLGISLTDIKTGIESYQTNFGRAETKIINGVKTQVFLIKNPTGATEVLKILSEDQNARFLIIINDNYADGRDVSWLWDAEFELLNKAQLNSKKFFTSGSRAYDMATRLKYAGIKHIEAKESIDRALDLATSDCQGEEKLFILPTYTSLLHLEKIK